MPPRPPRSATALAGHDDRHAFRPLTDLIAPRAAVSRRWPRARAVQRRLRRAQRRQQCASIRARPPTRRWRRGSADAGVRWRSCGGFGACGREPVRGVMRAVASLSSSSVVGERSDYVNEASAARCAARARRRSTSAIRSSPMPRTRFSLRDFGDMFRPGGLLDDFFQKRLAPFVTEQRNGYAPVSVDGGRLPLKREALAQFYRARAIRNAFFAGSGARLAQVQPAPELPRPAVAARDAVDRRTRHRLSPRADAPYDIEWPTKDRGELGLGHACVDLDGKETRVEKSGAWSLLRMVDAACSRRAAAPTSSASPRRRAGRRPRRLPAQGGQREQPVQSRRVCAPSAARTRCERKACLRPVRQAALDRRLPSARPAGALRRPLGRLADARAGGEPLHAGAALG